MATQTIPRLVIAAPHSHSGKTTVTLALLAALRQRGLRVAPFKVGPDYIDPQMHRQAAGCASYNLDTYLVPAERVRDTFCRVAQDADIAIVEGVMGLFDGSAPTSRVGSTAEVAALLQAPIVLVIDASGMAASVGALIRGFRTYDPEVHVAGVILNRLGSAGHARYLEPAIAREGVEILGYLPKDTELTIPERHLGLLPTSEEDRVTPLLGHLTTLATRHFHLDQIIRLARTAPALPLPIPLPRRPSHHAVRIAWAQDAAFHFWYQENMDALAAAGADIVLFSPLEDPALPPDLDAVWLGGGFPEHFGAPLAANTGMHAALQAHAARGLPIYAECGGLMYLCEWLEDQHGQRYPQVGLIPGGTRMTKKVTTIRLCRGHIFARHPARSCQYDRAWPPFSLFGLRAWQHATALCLPHHPRHNGRDARRGILRDSVLATYLHVHLGSQPHMAQYLVDFCRRQRQA